MDNKKELLATPQPEAVGQGDASDNAAPEGEGAGRNQTPATSREIPAACEKLQAEKAELYERLLRKQAELENFRKRSLREKEEFRQHATADLIRPLLPVLDGFERALRQRDAAVPEPFYQGMELIHRQLFDVLARAGLEAVETSGQLFDPHYHQAVETVEDAARRDHAIVEELQRGYKLRHHLLRPAIVKVAVKPKAASCQAAEEIVKAD